MPFNRSAMFIFNTNIHETVGSKNDMPEIFAIGRSVSNNQMTVPGSNLITFYSL